METLGKYENFYTAMKKLTEYHNYKVNYENDLINQAFWDIYLEVTRFLWHLTGYHGY